MTHHERLKALTYLYPQGGWVCDSEGAIRMEDGMAVPSAAELSQALIAAKRFDYRQARAALYPDLADQLDALWKGESATAEMRARILAIKQAHPKPADMD
jgi:hypothetical protein